MKTVLAPVDFSVVTSRVADSAVKLARAVKGRVLFLHVEPKPSAIRNILPAVEDVEMKTKTSGHDAEKKLGDLKRDWQRHYRSIDVTHVTGAPAQRILEQAKDTHADYVVMGSHGQSGVRDVLIGSVASTVVKKSPCPVLVVPRN